MALLKKSKKDDNLNEFDATVNRSNNEEKDNFYWLRFLSSDVFDLKPVKILKNLLILWEVTSLLIHLYYFLRAFDFEAILTFIPLCAFTFSGSITLSYLVIFGSFIPKNRQYKLWANNSAGIEAKTKIEQEVKLSKIFLFLNTFLAVLIGSLHLVPHETDAKFFLIIKLLQETRTDFGMVLAKVYSISNTFFLHCMLVTYYQFIYDIQHIKIQLFLLRKSIENFGSEEKQDCELFYDEDFQIEIKRQLKFCVMRYQEILQACVNLNKEGGAFLAPLVISGLSYGIGVVIYLYLGVTLGNYIRTAATIMIFITTFCATAFVGQLLETESEKIPQAFLDRAWYTWNQENKKILLTFLANINKPLSFKFTDAIRLNYNLGVNMMKGIYSVASLFVQL